MGLVLLGMIFLFLKFNFTLLDTSLFYIMTNLFGMFLLKLGLDESECVDGQKVNDQLWFYGIMNVVLLTCRLFDVQLHGIGLEYFDSYLLALTLLFAHFYIFFYPLYIFSALLKHGTYQLQKPFSNSVNYMVIICVSLALIIVSSDTSELARTLLWTAVITLELNASLRLLINNRMKIKSDFRIGKRLMHLFRKTL